MFTPSNPFYAQVRLLVAVLPFVGMESCFALKGGTAINLFVRDMPRLSVDIDLAYVPIGEREPALDAIDAALNRIKARLESMSPPYRAQITRRESGRAYAMQVSDATATIKIEVSPVLRGSVYPEATRQIVSGAQAEFGFAEMQMLSVDDLYAGKIVAALDRQHPRDLFDVKVLLESGGISDDMFRSFLVYLISHDGSIARVIDPLPKDISNSFERQFMNMTAEPVALPALIEARDALKAALHMRVGDSVKEFLLSFKRGEPRWELLGVDHAPQLPAVRWKLQNLARWDAKRRDDAIRKLEEVLDRI